MSGPDSGDRLDAASGDRRSVLLLVPGAVLVAILARGAGVGVVLLVLMWLRVAEFSGLQVSPNLSCRVWILPKGE